MSVNSYCSKCGAECQAGDLFCKACGNSMATGSVAINPTSTAMTKSQRSPITALFLCMYLGFFGIHRFYTGKIGTGILMLVTLGGLGIWAMIDLVTIASSKFTDKEGRYLEFTSQDPGTKSTKSGNTTLLLALFLGIFGIHRFYVGKIGTGILMLLTLGGLGIWALIDIIVIACGNFTDKSGQYLNFTRDAKPSAPKITMVIGIALLSLLTLVSLIIASVFFATSGLTDAAREQLTALRQQDYEKAYSYTSNEFKKSASLEDFIKFVNDYPALSDNKNATFTNRSIDAAGTGVISGTLESSDGTTIPVTYMLVKENDQWKILNIDVKHTKAGVNETDSNNSGSNDNKQN